MYELLYEEDEEVIGSTIKVQGVTFTVVGVYSSFQTGEDKAEESNQHFCSLFLLQGISYWR